MIIKDDIRYKILESLAQHLDVDISSLGLRETTYIQDGLSKLLTIHNGGKGREVLSPDILRIKVDLD